MKLKKYLRSGLAILCSISMVFGMVGFLPQTADASTSTEKLPTGYTVVTPKDFGVDDYTGNTTKEHHFSTKTPINTRDKVMFSAKLRFNSQTGGGLEYMTRDLSASGGEGLVFEVSTSQGLVRLYNKITWEPFYLGDTYATESKTSYYFTDFHGIMDKDIFFTLTTDVLDYDGDGTADDVKLGVWIEGVLYNNRYLYILNGASDIYYEFYNLDMYATACTSFQVIMPEDFGIEDFTGDAATEYKENTKTPITSIDNLMFQAKLQINTSNGMFYLANGTAHGIQFYANSGQSYVTIYNKITWEPFYVGDDFSTATKTAYNFKALTSASVVGKETLYTITTEVIDYDGDGVADDIKLGVWFDGILHNNEYLYIQNGADTQYSAFTNLRTKLTSCVSPYTTLAMDSTQDPTPDPTPDPDPEPTPDPTPTPTNKIFPTGYTVVTPEDFGIEDFEGYTGAEYKENTKTPIASVDKLMFQAKLKINTSNGMFYLANGTAHGLQFYANSGQSYVTLYNKITWEPFYVGDDFQTATKTDYNFKALTVTSVVGKEVIYTITTDVLDYDGDGATDDIRLGIWFDGVLHNNEYLYIQNGADSVYSEFKNLRLKMDSATSFQVIMPKDFGIEDFAGDAATEYKESTKTPITTLDNVMFQATLQINASQGMFYLANGTAHGLQFYANSGQSYVTVYNKITWEPFYVGDDFQTATKTDYNFKALTAASVVGREALYTMTTEIIDYDGDGTTDDIKLGVWFDGVLHNNEYLYIQNGADSVYSEFKNLRTKLVSCESPYITLAQGTDPDPGPEPEPEPDPVTPPTFPEVTFRDYGVESGIYTGKADLVKEATYTGGLANKTFVGKMNFSEKSRTSINFGGTDSGWKGFAIGTWTDGTLWYWDQEGKIPYKQISTSATTAVGEGQTIKISFEVTDIDDDGQEDDVRIWLYFGDTLYNNAPLCEAIDYAPYVGTYLGIRCYNADSSVIIASKDEGAGAPSEPVELPLKELTFSDMKIDDGIYGYVDGEAMAVDKKYKESFVDKSFVGIVNFPTEDGASLYLGGNAAKKGVHITTKDGKIYFTEADNRFTEVELDESVVEDGLRGQDVKYKVSFEYTDSDNDGLKDDVRIWLYINDKLYKDAPVVEATNYVIYVGSYIGIFSNNQEASIKVASAEIYRETWTEPKLPEVTFGDFEIDDGTYSKEENNGCSAIGYYREGLANKSFVGTVNFNGAPLASIQFGGTTSEWLGVRLMVLSDGNLYFMESEGVFNNIKLTEELAETQLVGVDVKVRLTVEVTDLDSDGKKDDVRYWLSFNDILYNGTPIVEVLDYANKVGNRLGIYASAKEATVTVKSVKINRPAVKVDFSIMGFTDNWESEIGGKAGGASNGAAGSNSPYIGDGTPITFYFIVCVAVLVGMGLWYYYKKRRNVTE